MAHHYGSKIDVLDYLLDMQHVYKQVINPTWFLALEFVHYLCMTTVVLRVTSMLAHD